MMLPGFIDSHMHASMTVSSLYSVLLYGMTERGRVRRGRREFARPTTRTWT